MWSRSSSTGAAAAVVNIRLVNFTLLFFQFLIERLEKGNLGSAEKETLLKTVKVVTASISKLKREVEVATFSAVPGSKAVLLKKEVRASSSFVAPFRLVYRVGLNEPVMVNRSFG